MKDDLLKRLRAVRYTLDNVETHGKENMDRLLGCMNVLDDVIGKLEKLLTEEKP